jgi:DNA polymerase-3 subunit gamma/tau
VFENILGQPAAELLAADIAQGRLAPALLFSGPAASGKGTAALELARVISCEGSPQSPRKRASWNCACPACARHRLLLHPDLLCLGSRPFSAEIAAAAAAFLREPALAATETLFIRSVRKLLARFNPALWEDEPKFSKLSPFVVSLEEGLDELDAAKNQTGETGGEKTKKAVESLIKESLKLEAEGIEKTIPIGRIRRAAWWGRLAPAGKGKLLLIENADRMQEAARNSLLKLLEEPPGPVTLVLTSARPNTLLQTILSRLRPYRFAVRDEAAGREVIRRVFRGDAAAKSETGGAESKGPGDGGGLIGAYLDSFLPVPDDTLRGAAAFFAASAAANAVHLLKRRGAAVLVPSVLSLGKYAAPLAEAAGFGRPVPSCREAAALTVKGAAGFEIPSLFSRFLKALLDHVSASLRQPEPHSPEQISFAELWRDCAGRADSAVSVYNQTPSLALERLFVETGRGMAELGV